ncbi:Ger(x)C family spore germination protein [Clostridium paridis]|uniref:Ger(X)C family spore germination protein n=1 Tax=Clostridium paridis TaxID=2803863 RepID=A0A937FE82_9CLOT|nr:Ger(x)C family spore germination protein [Clostridium paridis]MBL4930363.1 Ger(x)C family spore germination protein [Clostridium paridis]
MKMKYISIFLLFFMTLSSISGCVDRTELEEQAYVSAIGLDKGTEDRLSITYQITNVRHGAKTETDTGPKNETITFEAPDFISARHLANTVISRRITLTHAKILIIGEEFARDPDFFHQLEAALRENQLKRGMNILVSKETASEFLRANDPKVENRTSKYFDFMYDRWKDTGYVPESDLNKFMQRTEGKSSLYLAVYLSATKNTPKHIYKSPDTLGNEADYLPGEIDIEGGNPTQMIGSAVFKDGKMIGVLTGNENRINVILRPSLSVRSMIFTFEDPLDKDYKVTARILQYKKNKYHFNIKGTYPEVEVTIPLKVEILAIPSFTKYVEDLEKQEILKHSMEDQLKVASYKLVRKTQQEFKGEPFLWGSQVLRPKFFTYEEYKNYNWSDKYPNAKVNIDYKIDLLGFGKQMNPPEKNNK